MVAVEIGVAVKFHDICFGILFLNLRRQQDFHDFAGEALFLGQIGVLYHLLCDGASALGDLAAVFDEGETCTEGSNPVNTGVGFEASVFLGNISILQIHADLADGDIFVMSGIDQADQLIVFIVYFCVRQHTEVLALHLRQLIVGNFPAVVQLRTYLRINEQANEAAQKQTAGQNMQDGLKQPSEDSEQADKKAG